jgi:quinol monooxygenase YgiN
MQRRTILGLAAVAVLAAGGILGRQIFAQDKPAQNDVGTQLVAALKQSPGCLGVEVGQMKSGKLSIFAWFKDKAALVDWYYSDPHQNAMDAMLAGIKAKQHQAGSPAGGSSGAPAGTPKDAPAGAPTAKAKSEPGKGGKEGGSAHTPLEFVADGTGPILCIATITPSATPAVPGFPMAIGQISIELYQPLPGGASFGGTFAPPSVPLEHHRGERTAEPAAPAPGKAPSAPKGG